MLLIGRVADDGARALSIKAKADSTLAYCAKSKAEADECLNYALQNFMQVNALIGKLLRELNQLPAPI